MTNLEAPITAGRRSSAKTIPTPLAGWNAHIEALLADDRAAEALPAIRTILRQLPQHLTSYQRLLEVAWRMGRWEEGHDWGARLLRADPGNARAWRAMAMAVEKQGNREEARAIWQRAFESDPYEPDVRTGIYRTGLHDPKPLELNEAGLAMITMRSHRWHRAANLYEALVDANGPRKDFRTYQMVSLWQSGDSERAYATAQALTRRDRYLLLPWVVLHALGDDNDRALALHPVQSMDPDGEYVWGWFGIETGRSPISIDVSEAEAEQLQLP